MKKESKRNFCIAVFLLVLFAVWTMLVSIVDVKPIGPQNSSVGFASLNLFFHNLTGVHMWFYTATDWLSIIPLGIAAGFGVVGLKQWIERKSIFIVDYDIIALGVFYIAVLIVYILFEEIALNFRPVLIEGKLEASYPSSTTVLVLCVMLTAKMQSDMRIKNVRARKVADILITVFTVFMVVGRTISGVHWLTDIIGGILLSAGLVMMYYSVIKQKRP